MFPSLILLVNYLLSGIPDKFKFSQENNERILSGLFSVKAALDTKYNNGNLTNPREIIIRQKLTLFIPNFQVMIEDQGASQKRIVEDSRSSRLIFDKRFLIGYIALSIWTDKDNPKDFDLNVPFQDVKEDGSFYTPPPPPSVTHCNRFAYLVILKATGQRMTKGESYLTPLTHGEELTKFGMMGAGVYFGNEREKSDAAIMHLSMPTDTGEFGDIISFSKDDQIHLTGNDFSGPNHVGIFIDFDLYVSASGTGVSPIPQGERSVTLGNVPHHAHFCSVK